MGNEPAYVDGGESPARREIYYHSGLDIGGCEGMVDVVSACDGLVASAGGKALPEYADAPYYKPRGDYDYVYVLDAQGWYYRYAHLKSIDPAVRPGERVKMGQKIGLLGKEGSSGGWAHLHFDIKWKQPSGKWGILDGYAFLWEAYQREHQPKLVAVARPHHLIWAGEKVTLDGSRSWSASGKIRTFEWAFGDGTTAKGSKVGRTYDRPGSYCETLKIVDAEGRIDYDFAVVQVLDKAHPDELPPTIHAAYAPTFGSNLAIRSRSKCGPSALTRARRRGTSATAARRWKSNRTGTPSQWHRMATPRRRIATKSRDITLFRSSAPATPEPRPSPAFRCASSKDGTPSAQPRKR